MMTSPPHALSSRAIRALVVVIVVGALACVLGISTCASYANRLFQLGTTDGAGGSSPEAIAEIAGRGLLIIAMTSTGLLSTVLACLAFGLRTGGARAVITGAAALNVLLVVFVFASSWRSGWYYMLDPVSSDAARPFAGLVAVQTIAWIVAGCLALPGRRNS
jgi:hypothetical protein